MFKTSAAALIALCVGFIVLACIPAFALEGTATVKVSDITSLAQRKNYRLGVRASLITPDRTVLINRDNAYEVGLEFDAKLNENLDTGPRFGYGLMSANVSSTFNASYSFLKFGYGARMYLTYFGDYGSTHGFVNVYVHGDGDYYIVNKTSEVVANSPPSFAGFGAQAGAGVELAFGPNATGFVDVNYLRTFIRDNAGNSLPMSGFTIAVGSRLAFI